MAKSVSSQILLTFCLGACVWNIGVHSTQCEQRQKVILLGCGSFNPPTLMHLRMFEIARDHLRDSEQIEVIGGIMSPVHDTYNKGPIKLVHNHYRLDMVQLAIESSDWIRLSRWEIDRYRWSPTINVFHYHQDYLNSLLNGTNKRIPSWLPVDITELAGQKIRIQLLGGSDLFESMVKSKSWTDTEIETLLNTYGLVVVTRDNLKLNKLIFDSDLLFKHRMNITIAQNFVPNDLSSALVRFHLRRGLSVKYLSNDDVINYIYEKRLYNSDVNRDKLTAIRYSPVNVTDTTE